MNRTNYEIEMEKIIAENEKKGRVPSLLLHSCCGPCSSAVMERLTPHFEVTVFYYNPNISPEGEYRHRVEEQKRLIRSFPAVHPIRFLEGEYHPEDFDAAVRGYEDIPEGGERCFRCYELRLRRTAEEAARRGFDYFATTLSVSPLKNAGKINEIGRRTAEKNGQVLWLPSDFKKKNGYQRSIELSREYNLYRQNFCGCVYSLRRDFCPAGAQST